MTDNTERMTAGEVDAIEQQLAGIELIPRASRTASAHQKVMDAATALLSEVRALRHEGDIVDKQLLDVLAQKAKLEAELAEQPTVTLAHNTPPDFRLKAVQWVEGDTTAAMQAAQTPDAWNSAAIVDLQQRMQLRERGYSAHGDLLDLIVPAVEDLKARIEALEQDAGGGE